MQSQDYKSRTRNVRREARAHLMALRRARTAQRTASKRVPDDITQPTLTDQEVHQPAVAFVHRTEDMAADSSPFADPNVGPLTDDQLESAAIEEAAVAELSDDNAADAQSRPAHDFDDPFTAVNQEDPMTCAPLTEAYETAVPAEAPDDILTEANPFFQPEAEVSEEAFCDEVADAPTPPPVADDEFATEAPGDLPDIWPNEPTTDPAIPSENAAPVIETESAPDAGPTSLASNLTELPGAGPGLIWMLNQCEVYSLADLATQDAIALSERLGIVGQILDVRQWILLAQSKTSA